MNFFPLHNPYFPPHNPYDWRIDSRPPQPSARAKAMHLRSKGGWLR
jgi:hypothetical protein